MKILTLTIFVVIFSSCAQTLRSRSPSSSIICEDYFLKKFKVSESSETESLIESLFIRNVDSKSFVKYQINFDKIQTRIKNVKRIYSEDLKVSSMGKYDGEELYRIDLNGWGSGPRKKIIISAGVHGNESAAVATVFNFLDKNIYNPHFRNNFDLVIIPYLNPNGLKQNLRRLRNDSDLNRSFKPNASEGPTYLLRESLKGESFDLAFDLHEAPTREKFFVIKAQKDDDNLTKNVISHFDKNLFFTTRTGSYPDGIPSSKNPSKTSYKLYSPGETVSYNVGTVKQFYRGELKVPYAYTLESPGIFDLEEKIKIYTELIEKYTDEYLLLPISH